MRFHTAIFAVLVTLTGIATALPAAIPDPHMNARHLAVSEIYTRESNDFAFDKRMPVDDDSLDVAKREPGWGKAAIYGGVVGLAGYVLYKGGKKLVQQFKGGKGGSGAGGGGGGGGNGNAAGGTGTGGGDTSTPPSTPPSTDPTNPPSTSG